jgi:hypothetical protein
MSTRQQKWKAKRLAEGKCTQCGKERENLEVQKCAACTEKANTRLRAARGYKPWEPGKPGRRPAGASL